MRADGTFEFHKHCLVSNASLPLAETHQIAFTGPSFPFPPVMPGAILMLQLLISDPIADLTAIGDLIRNDIGLSVRVFQIAADETKDNRWASQDIDQLAVLIGLNKLRELSQTADLLSHPNGSIGVRTFERFHAHAQLTALIAEELAEEIGDVDPEKAYMAGFFRNLGALPFILGWNLPELRNADTELAGQRLAQSWRLPEFLLHVIRGNHDVCPASLHNLLTLVNTADAHAVRLELGYQY